MTRIDIDAAMVKAQIAALIAAHPELAEDEDLRLDTLEGQSELYELAGRVAALIAEAKAMTEAIKSRENDLAVRRTRFANKAAFLQGLLKSLMDAAKQTKLVLPEATLSITKGRESVVIIDEAALDQGFYRIERVPLKFELAEALKAGASVNGAKLVTSDPILTIRTK